MLDEFLREDLNTKISYISLVLLSVITFIVRSKARRLKKNPLNVITDSQKIIWILSFLVICLSVLGFF
jgi:hypothetical protein